MPVERAHLSGVALNVLDPEKLAEFYTKTLGMHRLDLGDIVRVGYGGEGAFLELRQATDSDAYAHQPNDKYWKIGITLPNVDLAYDQLRQTGVPISQPGQFQDIGYMWHLADPEGFQIELLQHTFADQKHTSDGDPSLPLGGGAQIGQITLRTTEIEKDLARYTAMGMKLLSVQPVEGRYFELYFLAFTDEQPPNENLKAVENRPWLWQRPYTTLELQYLETTSTQRSNNPDGTAGYANLVFDAGL